MATGLSVETIQAALAGAVRSVVNEVPKFDGQGNADYWLFSFRKSTDGRTEAEKQKLFRQAMTGDAYTWHAGESLADETANRNPTCADWQVRLKKFYGKTRSLALDELEGRRMQEGESPLNFAQDVLRLCTEVDPGMDGDTRLRHLHRSLLPRFQKDMLLMDPKDTAAFTEKLVKLSAAGAGRRPAEDLSTRTLVSALVATLVDQRRQDATAMATACTADMDVAEALDRLNQRLDEVELGRRRTPVNRQNVTCYNCDRKGHFQYECRTPVRQQDENQES